MSLVSAKCTNCGANIQIDNSKEAGICQFCGSAFVTEKAIAIYNISNTVNVSGGSNTINVHNYVMQASLENKFLDKPYTITITRKKTIMMGALVKLSLIAEEGTYRFNNGDSVSFQTNKIDNHIEILENSVFTGGHNYIIDFKMESRDAEMEIKLIGGVYVISKHTLPKALMKIHNKSHS